MLYCWFGLDGLVVFDELNGCGCWCELFAFVDAFGVLLRCLCFVFSGFGCLDTCFVLLILVFRWVCSVS